MTVSIIPGGLPSMGLHKVGHDWNDLAAAAITITGNDIHRVLLINKIILYRLGVTKFIVVAV